MSGLLAASTEVSAAQSPYPGLKPFSEDESAFFFGRERDSEIIIANLRARRLTVLYGPSGVGKSSVLRAGVTAPLRRRAEAALAREGQARFAPVVVIDWKDDPVAGIVGAVQKSVQDLVGGDEPAPPATGRLDDDLLAWSEYLDGELLLILDQLEELFEYHREPGGDGSFDEELPRLVAREVLPVSILVSIREDALALLDDRFKRSVPGLLDSRLRIAHLDHEAARDAIIKPIAQFNREHGTEIGIEPDLVETVLEQVARGKVVLEQAGRGAVDGGEPTRGTVETPYLQLVLTRLWQEEQRAGSSIMRLETLARLGGAERIVRTHLDEALASLPADERDLAAGLFRYLVTPSGTKIALRAGDLAAFTGQSEEMLQPVLRQLASRQISVLRPIAPPPGDRSPPRYEIFHDVLASAVLDWRRRHEEAGRLDRERSEKEEAERQAREAREVERRERIRARKFRTLAVASVLLFLVAAATAFVAVRQTAAANRQLKRTERFTSAAVGRRAFDLLTTRPDAGMLAALEAYRLAETYEARSAVLAGLHHNIALPAILAGHPREVNAVAFSPDSGVLASVGSEGALRLWNVRSGYELAVLAPKGVVLAVAFGDERTLAAGDDNGMLRLWNVADPSEPIARAAIRAGPSIGEGDYANIKSVAFSPDGRTLAVGLEDGRIRFWRVTGAQELLPVRRTARAKEEIWGLAFNRDGTRLASASDSVDSTTDGVVSVWDVSNLSGGAPFKRSTAEHVGVTSIAFREDGEMLASGGEEGEVILWDVAGGEIRGERARLTGHFGVVFALGFSPDGSVLASGGDDNTLLLWDVERRLPFGGPRTHTDNVRGLAVSRDGKTVASASHDGLVKLWPVGGRSLATTLGTAADVNRDVAVGSDSTLAVAGDPLRLWDLDQVRPEGGAGGSQRRPLPGKESSEETWNVAFAGNLLAAVTATDVELGRFPEPGELTWPLKVGKTGLSVDLDPENSRAAVGTTDGQVMVWDISDPAKPGLLDTLPKAHRGDVSEIAFSPSGTTLATAGEDGKIRLWDVKNPKQVTPRDVFIGHEQQEVTSLAFAPDGRMLASGGGDQRIAFSDVTDVSNVRRLSLPFQQQTDTILALAFSPDGKLLAAGDGDEDIVLWDVERRETLGGDLAAHTKWEAAPEQYDYDPALDSLAFDERGYLISAGPHVPVVVWSSELWSADYETLHKNVCAIVRRPLNEAEWQHFFGDTRFEDEKPEACVQRQR